MSSRRAQKKFSNRKSLNSGPRIDYSRELLLLVTRYVPQYVENVSLNPVFENQSLPLPKNAGSHQVVYVRNILYVESIPYKDFMRMIELNCKLPKYSVFHVQFVCSILQIWSHGKYIKQIKDTIAFFPLHSQNTYIHDIRVMNVWKLIEQDPVYFQHQMSELKKSLPKVVFTILNGSNFSVENVISKSKVQSLIRFAVKIQHWAQIKALSTSQERNAFIVDTTNQESGSLKAFCELCIQQNPDAAKIHGYPDPDSIENEFENLKQMVAAYQPIPPPPADNAPAPPTDNPPPQLPAAPAAPIQSPQLSPMDTEESPLVPVNAAPVNVKPKKTKHALKTKKASAISKRSASSNVPSTAVFAQRITGSKSSEIIAPRDQATPIQPLPATPATVLLENHLPTTRISYSAALPVNIGPSEIKRLPESAVVTPMLDVQLPTPVLPTPPSAHSESEISISLVVGNSTSLQRYSTSYTVNDVIMDELGIVNFQHHIITLLHQKYDPLKDNRTLQLHDVICVYPSGETPDINVHVQLLNGSSFRTMLPSTAYLTYLFGATRSEFASSMSTWKYKRIAPGNKNHSWTPLPFSDLATISIGTGLRVVECPSVSA